MTSIKITFPEDDVVPQQVPKSQNASHICTYANFTLANPVSEHEIEFAYLLPNVKIHSREIKTLHQNFEITFLPVDNFRKYFTITCIFSCSNDIYRFLPEHLTVKRYGH